jgi:hypothetical protein
MRENLSNFSSGRRYRLYKNSKCRRTSNLIKKSTNKPNGYSSKRYNWPIVTRKVINIFSLNTQVKTTLVLLVITVRKTI